MTDPRDPLTGADPYPRHLIDRWDLDRERADLLEAIVSTPGPGRQPMPGRTRVLLSLGIAAALAIIGGGGWLIASGDDGGDGGDTAVASAPRSSAAPGPSAPASDSGRAGGKDAGCRALMTRKGQLHLVLPGTTAGPQIARRLPTQVVRRDQLQHLLRSGCTIGSLRSALRDAPGSAPASRRP